MKKKNNKYDTKKVGEKVCNILVKMKMYLNNEGQDSFWYKNWQENNMYNGNLHPLADRLMSTMLKVHGHYELAKIYEDLCDIEFWFE